MRANHLLAALERRKLAEAEHVLLKALQSGGLRAAEKLVAGLNAKGRRFELLERSPVVRAWGEVLPNGRIFRIQVGGNRAFKYSSVRDLPPEKPASPPTRRDLLQKQFYDRYMEIGQKYYRKPGMRLSPADQRLLLVGELEADVNNGGFAQYLDNKGRRRARAALTALKSIGARKTAAMLERAMAPGVTEAELGKLDSRFYEVPEDLAVLSVRRAARPRSR
jgi:hypothetical protein